MGSLPLTGKPFFPPHLHSFSPHTRLFSATSTTSVTLKQRPKLLASRDDETPPLDSYDLMELKFGRLLGEDPKLTLAKIMGRKANPDASFLDIEKSFHKNKGKVVHVEQLPFEASKSPKLDGVNLPRPVPPKGIKFQDNDQKKAAFEIKKPLRIEGNVRKSSVPNVILRKPTVYKDDGDQVTSSRLRIRPNLSLKMPNDQVKDKFSDMTLLRKPEEPVAKSDDTVQPPPSPLDDRGNTDGELKMWKEGPGDEKDNLILLERPHKSSGKPEEGQLDEVNVMVPNDGVEQHEQAQVELHQVSADLSQSSDLKSVDSSMELWAEAALQTKPKRLDQNVKRASNFGGEEGASLNPGGERNNESLENAVDASDFQESENADWTRAENLRKSGDREDVEVVSCNTKGFMVSFGSLVGFLPYRNLFAKWKFIAFEPWLKQKGLDPSKYKQHLGTITTNDAESTNSSPDSPPHPEIDGKVEDKISPDTKLEDLLRIYDQEKIMFLSSFIGQKIKANVLVADKKMRKLIFSLRPKENEELIEKKKNLMARLQVGDIVKCQIQKITYFGVFVEVEGVSALIHQSQLSWDATLNPLSYFKIGQVIEAKVHQLNHALGRIFLSLKEVMPDPLMNSLEAIVGDDDTLDGRLEAVQTDAEWPEVDSLIKELQKIEGVQSVSKGRFFRSPGLAPTFQVYMSSIFEDQYKLLARSGNKIQEVIVQTSLGKERMKSVVMTCATKME